MDQLAPKEKQGPFSLHDYLFPQWFQLKATVTSASARPDQGNPEGVVNEMFL